MRLELSEGCRQAVLWCESDCQSGLSVLSFFLAKSLVLPLLLAVVCGHEVITHT